MKVSLTDADKKKAVHLGANIIHRRYLRKQLTVLLYGFNNCCQGIPDRDVIWILRTAKLAYVTMICI